MSEAKDIPPGTYKLEFGSTFSDPKRETRSQFHTLRYDFKPKSVASNDSESYIAYGTNGDVHVAVPTEGNNLTVYKGAKKEAKPKECLLFFDKKSGSLRLEKISSNIQVKKARDIDKSTEIVLRNEMSRLRTENARKGKEKGEVNTNHSDDQMSSSSSSDSSDSESDSGSDTESKTTKQRRESNSSMSDMESALIATVNASSQQLAPPSAPPVASGSFRSNPPPPPPPSSSSYSSKPNSHGDLGLNLSDDSSDED
ncbi:unnamed protein product [Auanema sp. JU1783]|nr:unnamed protein product [Auanema sp. JU1783]